MSIKYLTAVWESETLDGSRLLVMLALADHANDCGRCWPSIARLARRARISSRHTSRILRELEAAGHIEIVQPGSGRGHTSVYQVLPNGAGMTSLAQEKGDGPRPNGDAVSPIAAGNADRLSRFPAQKDDMANTIDDMPGANGDIAMADEPPIEPSIESSEGESVLRPDDTDADASDSGRSGDPALSLSSVIRLWKQEQMPPLTKTVREHIRGWVDGYGAGEVVEAIKIASLRNNRTGQYIHGILKKRAERRELHDFLAHSQAHRTRPRPAAVPEPEPQAIRYLREIRELANAAMTLDGEGDTVLVQVDAPEEMELRLGWLARRTLTGTGCRCEFVEREGGRMKAEG